MPTPSPSFRTEAELRAAMRDRRYWDPTQPGRTAFVQVVTRGWQDLVAAGESQRMVAVRACTRVVDGKPQHVGAYIQARAAGHGEAAPASAEDGAAGGTGTAPAAPTPVPGRPVVIFIGGANDGADGPVRQFYSDFAGQYPKPNRDYFSHADGEGVRQRIAALPPGTPVTLVGHSWGGQEAIRIAAERAEAGQPIATLVTIDPVGNAQSPEVLALARSGSRRWINVQATGGAWSEPSNLIARIGNRYGEAPRRRATEFIQAPEIHADFSRMLRSRISGGGTIEDLLHGRRIAP